MSLGIKLDLQEETALTTAASSGSNEAGSVSEMNRHRIERKMREILVAQRAAVRFMPPNPNICYYHYPTTARLR